MRGCVGGTELGCWDVAGVWLREGDLGRNGRDESVSFGGEISTVGVTTDQASLSVAMLWFNLCKHICDFVES
jgi:hypothetical protein